MPDFPPELLLLLPLAIAAGVDLYLTLLFLGAAPTLGLWETPLPGALGDLDPPAVLIMMGALYLVEFATERVPGAALLWNGFHAIIRPVSGGLLALLLLDGQALPIVLAGVLTGGSLAALAHGVRTGGACLRWLGAASAPSILLVSLAEDVAVLGLASLALDRPGIAAGVSAFLVVVAAPFAPSLLRAFAWSLRLVVERVFLSFGFRRWRGTDELPQWAIDACEGDENVGPGGAVRGAPVGAWSLPGAPRFSIGWIVVHGAGPVFVHRTRRGAHSIDLTSVHLVDVVETRFFRRVRVENGAAHHVLYFGRGGPSVESLRVEFLST